LEKRAKEAVTERKKDRKEHTWFYFFWEQLLVFIFVFILETGYDGSKVSYVKVGS